MSDNNIYLSYSKDGNKYSGSFKFSDYDKALKKATEIDSSVFLWQIVSFESGVPVVLYSSVMYRKDREEATFPVVTGLLIIVFIISVCFFIKSLIV